MGHLTIRVFSFFFFLFIDTIVYAGAHQLPE